MQLLERVVRQHVGVGVPRDLEDERVAATDRACGRRDELAGEDSLPRTRALVRVDAMTERRVDDHGDLLVAVLLDERANGFVELGEAGRGSSLGGDVRTIDDDVRMRPMSDANATSVQR